MAKKEARRAARGPQKEAVAKKRGGLGGPPTVKGALIQSAIFSSVYLLLLLFVFRRQGRPWLMDVLFTLLFFMVFAVFIYYWQGFIYRRRQKRAAEKKSGN